MTLFERLGIPGPKPNLIIGNVTDIMKRGTCKAFPEWTKKYGPIVGFYLGARPQLLISDLDLIGRILITDFRQFNNRHVITPGGIHPQLQFKDLMVWANGDAWKKLRTTLSTSFSSSKLNKMEEAMTAVVDNMLSEVEVSAKSGREFNFKSHAYKLSFDIDTNCIFGVNVSNLGTRLTHSMMESVSPKLERSVLVITMMLFPALTFITYPLRVLWETIRLKMMWSHEGVFVEFVKNVVKTHRESKIRRDNFLQLLLDCEETRETLSTVATTKQRLSEEAVIANAFTFFLASFETTATALQYVISDLVNNQNVQDELRNKLQHQVALHGGAANLDVFTKVPLLSYVIMESLRMHPPVAPFTTRSADKDYNYNGLLIPKKTGIFIDVISVQNDVTVWSEPEKYQPERFSKDFNKVAFLPFGIG